MLPPPAVDPSHPAPARPRPGLRESLGAVTRHPVFAGAVFLTFLYFWRYLGFDALPGNGPANPAGWWTWFDQGKYIDSARALAKSVYDPGRHWYPLGYALLGAPFIKSTPVHPFAFVDLAALLVTYAAFVAFARRLAIGPVWSVLIFIGAVAGSRILFAQWVIPWNTSVTSALIWCLLALVAAHMQGVRRPFLIGLLAASIPFVRPAEAILVAIGGAAFILHEVGTGPKRALRDLGLVVLGALIPVAGYALLHWRIYGLAPSAYMIGSRDVGFTLYDLPWKASTLLVDPSAWYLDGVGLLRAAPYMALTVAGLAVAFAHGRAAALLAVLLVAHGILYLSYVDLLPTGLWRYYNVHYWKWAVPGAALLAFLLVRDLVRWRRAPAFPLAPLALAASLPLLCLRIDPVPALPGEPAKMVEYAWSAPDHTASYFGQLVMHDSAGPLRNVVDVRAFPIPGGLRVVAVRRDFVGDPAWDVAPPGLEGTVPRARYRSRLRFGLPCWLPGIRCNDVSNDTLPAAPFF
jgi:hypothetical protein